MAKTWTKSESLVAAHIKGVSVAAIEHHLETFREFIGHRKSGIYVLRKKRYVYYVGLASSVRKRLADHLKDHHRGKWDQFELYIIQENKVKYLEELETLLIRVAKPPGNKTSPNFIRHKNITKQFKQALEKKIAGFFNSGD
jgi:hypothetical protein